MTPLTPRLCTQAELESRLFRAIAYDLGVDWRLHRELWEFVAIARAFGFAQFSDPTTALGFAVGHEPLPAYFAWLDCEVLATDAPAVGKWDGQHASDLAAIPNMRLARDVFESHVAFCPVDMRFLDAFDHVPSDFVWSKCAFEHLGSLEAGLRFVREAMRFVAPGGLAVHTTEFTLSPWHTLRDGDVVLYRRQDIERLISTLRSDGMIVDEPNWSTGDGEADKCVDQPPYGQEPHLKLNVGGFITTSLVLPIRRPR